MAFWIVTAAVILVLGLLLFVVARNAAEEQDAKRKAVRAATQARSSELLRRRVANEAVRAGALADRADWNAWVECSLDDRPCVLLVHEARQLLRFVQFDNPGGFEALKQDVSLPLAKVLDVQLVRDDVLRSFERTETSPVETVKKKSALGRAVVGGVLLGPAGAIVGAVSAVPQSTKTTMQTTTVHEQRVVKGPPDLIVGTADSRFPLLRFRFPTEDLARAWLYRLQGARQATAAS